MANLSWPDIVIGVATGLAILVIYDIIYVWPIQRRFTALAARCNVLERTLNDAVDEVFARVVAVDHRSRDDANRLGERLGQLELGIEERSYEQAITSAERGEESARLVSCFGLTEGEADLVTLLHGDAAKRPEGASAT